MSAGRITRMVVRTWPLKEPFVISRQAFTTIDTLEVRVADQVGNIGRGAATGVDYAGETVETMMAQIEAARGKIEADFDRRALLELLPPGGARAAIDAALWDLEAKREGVSAFDLAGVPTRPVRSVTTIGMRGPAEMEAAARQAQGSAWLKIKVGVRDVVETVAAARRGAPHARLLVDPNQAWSLEELQAYAPKLEELGVELLEQPLAVAHDARLDEHSGPIPLCADESCDDAGDLPRLAGRFAAVNIKLDKIGGLTAALDLADAAERAGMGLMVGSMLGSSLTIAPALVLAQRCRWVDVDAPPFLVEDDEPGFQFEQGEIAQPCLPALWG